VLGSIAGDVIGSVYEGNATKSPAFPLFHEDCVYTDDTVLTVAVADCLLHDTDYVAAFKRYGRAYPSAGYGGTFFDWLFSASTQPYNSYGNGSAMRVSPVGFAFDSEERVLAEAKRSAEVTHNHPEGIKGAQAAALAIFLARTDAPKDRIRDEIQSRFNYDLNRNLADIGRHYSFDVTCQGSVPESIIAFLESLDFEDAVRKAVALGGDSDTMACITGGIAQAFYKTIPTQIVSTVRSKLPPEFLSILDEFNEKFAVAF
jgi:ADP-ribosylglycohydrolase